MASTSTIFGIPRSIAPRVAVATGTFFAVLTGHSMLETARDALFLSSLPASRLPWVYLVIAGLAVLVARLESRVGERFSARATLALTLAGSGTCTALFWLWVGQGDASLHAFYVWTGLIATVVVVQLWLLVGASIDPGQAKRAFATVGVGGLVGATFGSALSAALLTVLEPRHLILVAGAIIGLTALLPALAWRWPSAPKPRRTRRRVAVEAAPDGLLEHPYLRRLLLLVALTQMAVTSSDLLFKTAVAQLVDPEDLGALFALVYTGLNALSLVVQVLVAGWALRRFGVSRALWALPLLLGAGAVGFALTAALAPILFLKIVDGSLRHSLHRTGMELLYLPLPARLRERHKMTIDAVGGRGGQAVAALAMLGALSFGVELSVLALLVVVFIAMLLGSVALIKRGYVDMFRDRLREGTMETRASMPPLDLHSLEALIGGLSSEEDAVVLSAIDLLEASGRATLVTPLILYHPSAAVVVRALGVMSAGDRRDFVPLARRLVAATDEEVRTAALRALSMVGGAAEHARLRGALSDPSPAVRATALVGLIGISRGAAAFDRDIRAILEAPDPDGRLALARAIRHSPAPVFDEIVRELAVAREPATQAEVAGIIAAAPHPSYVPLLLPMLRDREVRQAARAALVAIGAPALAALDRALGDPEVPRRLRMHLPRTISRFVSQPAADVLSRHLERELDTVVGYKILRGLGRMVTERSRIRIDPALLERSLDVVLGRALVLLDWRVTLVEGTAAGPPTAAGPLLIELLREKEETAVERAFRLLGLRHPDEDVHAVYLGLRSDDPHTFASGRELIDHLVAGRVRAAILALVAERDIDDRARLALAAPFAELAGGSLDDALAAMRTDPSEAIAGLTADLLVELEGAVAA
ncbi:MAG TPA: MFS transporter [Kofleriaceae bacterium]|nr:MFS transporter [Kofleriaceae bacterium]